MSQKKFDIFFQNVTRVVMTIITIFAAATLYTVVGMKNSASVDITEYCAIPMIIEYILASLVAYIIFSFVITVFQSSVNDLK